MIRVLVVDDSLTVRKTVAAQLRDAGMEVVGEAADGTEGVRLTRELRPDVVLMDVVMPVCDGLGATRQIMCETPTPIVILSAHASRSEVFRTFDALAAGALEVCAKPVGKAEECERAWERILRTVRAANQVAVTQLGRRAGAPRAPGDGRGVAAPVPSGRSPELVVMGASTGGPSAVRSILATLPGSFPLPILLAIHGGFRRSGSLAEWLDRQCALPVRDARGGMRPEALARAVWVAPPGCDLAFSSGRTSVEEAAEGRTVVPCIDDLFGSAARNFGEAAVGVLLTGMGEDGAEGLRQIRDRGGRTIAQDPESCVVYGMPAAAVSLGAVERVAPLSEIPGLLVHLARSRPRISAQTGSSS